MVHPILSSRSNKWLYLISWLVVVNLHFYVLYLFMNQSFAASATDSFIFNTIFFAIGLGLWNQIRYSNFQKNSTAQIVLYHLAALALTLVIWISSAYYILANTIGDNQEYMGLLQDSIPWRVITGFFLFSLITLVYYLIFYYQNLQDQLLKEASLEKLVKQAEINVLKSQINPHFLFNSLNSVSSLTISNPDKAQEMVINLSTFLRYSLDQDMHEKNMLKQELDNIKLYLEIEKVRFGERLKFTYDIQENGYNAKIPNLILQPIYENAIKHGVHESTETVNIKTTAKVYGNMLEIGIQNNYNPEAIPRKGKGIGLKNIQDRLKLLYQRDDLLKVQKKDDCFEVKLLIPQTDHGKN